MIRDYISIARPDHWFKNVFMAPGILLGWMALKPVDPGSAVASVILGVVSTCLVASSNYTINELLDAPEDRKHPDKRSRPAASGRINPIWAYVQWIVLAAVGLAIAWMVNLPFFMTALCLFVMGIIYNVKPFRSKDRIYIDVLSESINNPLRFLLGWYAVGCFLIPPASLLMSYWMLGAFFMAVKRFAELRHIDNPEVAGAYRRSFRNYTPERLLISLVFYATAFGLFTGIFLIRYKVELILAIPFLGGLMAMYLYLGFLPDSPTQRPEELYRQKTFVAFTCVTVVVLLLCLAIRIPLLGRIFETTIPSGF